MDFIFIYGVLVGLIVGAGLATNWCERVMEKANDQFVNVSRVYQATVEEANKAKALHAEGLRLAKEARDECQAVLEANNDG